MSTITYRGRTYTKAQMAALLERLAFDGYKCEIEREDWRGVWPADVFVRIDGGCSQGARTLWTAFRRAVAELEAKP